MKYLISIIFIFTSLQFISCSDSSTGNEDPETESGEGVVNVSGALETQHQGISWYAGLQIEEEGEYANYTMHVSDVAPGENQQSSYSFSIRMVGDEGPFELTTGEYQVGEVDKGVLSISSYTNREGTNRRSYSSSPDTDGTFTIRSKSGTSVEATFDLQLEAGPSTEAGYITITGSLSANCFSSQTGGIGC